MAQILIGIVLFLLGLIMVATGFVWIGAIIVGPVVAIQGYKSLRNNQKQKEIILFFSVHAQELQERLLNKEPIDNIANHLFTNNAIPVAITYSFCGEFLMNELNSENKITVNKSLRVLKIQKQDFTTDLSKNIMYFSTDSTIIKYDDSSHVYIKNKKKDGILLLSKSHILFFPASKGFWKGILEKGWEKIWEKIYESPLFFIPLFVDLLFAVKNEFQKPLSKSKLKTLKNCFDKGKCIGIVIADIEKIETVKNKSGFFSNSCILITTNAGSQMCLGTKESNAKQWVLDMSNQIKIIALAEGKNLFSSKNKE